MFGAVLNRLATSVRRALSKYAVGTQEPELAFDFIDNEYITNNSTSNFASAITHSRSGNATMTDGYGPELVTNGGFDSGIDGWSVAGTSCTLSYDNGKAQTVCTGTDGNSRIGRSVGTLTAGTAYIFTLQYYEATSYGFIRVTSGSITGSSIQQEVNTTNNGNRRVTMVFVPSTTQEYFVIAGGNFTAGSVSTFDNVSVREMPVLKWAPHNLALYSEQFDQSWWSKLRASVTANQIVAPDGTTTADEVIEDTANGTHGFVTGSLGITDATMAVFAKQNTRSSIRVIDQSGNGALFDLSGGTIISTTSNFTSSITAVGNDWYLCSVSGTFVDNGIVIGLLDDSNLSTYTGDGSSSAYLWGAHVYRSDLGGMVDNPDRGDSYVPTTSSAKYLPRIGHHVYNGSAWVNEGLLAESEARTNLLPYSSNFGNSAWTKLRGAVTSDDIVSPTGQQDGDKYVCNETSANGMAINDNVSISAGSDFAGSMYVKKGSTDFCCVICYDGTNGVRQWFNISDGTVLSNNSFGTGVSLIQATIEDAGNGWFRVSVSADTSTANSTSAYMSVYPSVPADLDFDCTATTTYGYIFGAQIEAAATSSSYIPTDNNASVTRAAETFTIPSANLPWPSPNYIGSELVTNGDGSSTTNWSAARSNSTLTVTGGRLRATAINAGAYGPVQTLTGLTIGNVYQAKADVFTSGGSGSFYFRVVAASDLNATAPVNEQTSVDKSISVEFVATATTMYVGGINVASAGGDYIELDNISVREINPLSVSIAMDGRMTYADEDASGQQRLYSWRDDASNRLNLDLYTNSTNEGTFIIDQVASGTYDNASSGEVYSPDVLVPFNVSSRHGSTFVNLATDGTSHTANTTPTALPDLSATDLDLAYDYMGTVGTFRVWDKDLGDDGLVEATNPSLEPSLSLTFEGTGTNSFVVNDWSE